MSLRDLRLNPGYAPDAELDVAIVGAGTSGLYTAYRLRFGTSKDPKPKSVQIFDMSDRIAGRLYSVVLPGMEIAGELGGMRYLTSQEIVTALIENVFGKELEHVDFPMGDPAHLLFYLRKQRLQANAWDAAQQNGQKQATRYYLNDDDIGFSADQLFNKVIYDVLVADPWFMGKYKNQVGNPAPYQYEFKLTAREWDDIKPNLTYHFEGPYKGMKVNDLGFWNLVKDQVSQEGYNFLNEAGGYYSNTINWNAAEAFPYMVGDFSDASVSYRTIKGGYDQIAYALANAYLQTPGSEIWIRNELRNIERLEHATHRYRLTFRNLDTGKEYYVHAKQLVLAMPRRSLEMLDQQNFLFKNKDLQYHMESVIMEPSFKLLMGFEYPWWKEKFKADSGHSVTDLPMRQCYYFGTDPNDSHSQFLASYNDMETVTFWKALDDNHPQRFEMKVTKLLSRAAIPADIKNKASEVMVREAMHQVRELHGDNTIPDPYVALYKDWADDPFGGGYHAWKAAYDVKKTMEYMRKPLPGEDIHIIGEAYSDQQGWVEGAFCVAEKMLQDSFHMDWPSWLDKTYYLGW